MLSLIANLPIYLALGFKEISDGLFVVGFKLHIFFNTVAGKKLKEVDAAIKNMVEQSKQEAQKATNETTGDRKLYNIINGDNNGH